MAMHDVNESIMIIANFKIKDYHIFMPTCFSPL